MNIHSNQKITPFLWFDNQAEEAARFYTSIFPNSQLLSTSPGPDGTTMSVTFQLSGLEIYALNGGPQFQFTPAISLFVKCDDQQEIDTYWQKLGADGRYDKCGWLQDKYGLSWQIVPIRLGELLHTNDPEKSARAMQAMLKMSKLEIAELEAAYNG